MVLPSLLGAGHLFGSATSLYNTASKKRKLTPTPAFDTLDNAYHAPDTSSTSEEGPRSAPHASISRSAQTKVSDQELAEASASPSTASGAHSAHVAADSPSEAYAGLSIHSNELAPAPEGPGMNQGREDPLSLASDDEQVADTTRAARSSSPAKRRASAMEDGHMDVEQPGSDVQLAQTNGHTTSTNTHTHTREASVDMLTASASGSASTDPSSVSETPADQEMDDVAEAPPIDEQVDQIMAELRAMPEDGQVGYVMASAWLNRVLARSKDKDTHGPYDKEVLEGDIGPIDNSSILPARE